MAESEYNTDTSCKHTDSKPDACCKHTDSKPDACCKHTDSKPDACCKHTDSKPDACCKHTDSKPDACCKHTDSKPDACCKHTDSKPDACCKHTDSKPDACCKHTDSKPDACCKHTECEPTDNTYSKHRSTVLRFQSHYCKKKSVDTEAGQVTFPRTDGGSFSYSAERCNSSAENEKPLASRFCGITPDGAAVWDPPVLLTCDTDLQNLSQVRVYTKLSQVCVYTKLSQVRVYTKLSQVRVYTKLSQVRVYTKLSQVRVYTKLSKVRVYTKLSQVRVYTKLSQVRVYTKLSQVRVYTKLPQVRVYTKLSQVRVYTKLSQVSIYTKLSRVSIYTKLSQVSVNTKLSKVSVYTKLSQVRVYTKLSQVSVYTKLSKVSVYTKLSQVSVYTKLSQVSVYTKLSQVSVYTKLSQVRVYTKLSQVRVYTKLSQVRVYTKLSHVSIYTKLSQGTKVAGCEFLHLRAGARRLPYSCEYRRPYAGPRTQPNDSTQRLTVGIKFFHREQIGVCTTLNKEDIRSAGEHNIGKGLPGSVGEETHSLRLSSPRTTKLAVRFSANRIRLHTWSVNTKLSKVGIYTKLSQVSVYTKLSQVSVYTKLSKIVVNNETALSVATELQLITTQAETLSSSDVDTVIATLQKIVNASATEQITTLPSQNPLGRLKKCRLADVDSDSPLFVDALGDQGMWGTQDNLFKVNVTVLQQSQGERGGPARAVQALETFADTVILTTGTYTTVRPRVALQAADISPEELDKGQVSLDKVRILDSEPDFFARGFKETICIRALQPSLNRDGGRHRLSATYDPLLTSHVCYRNVTEAVDCSFDKDWSCTVENLGFAFSLSGNDSDSLTEGNVTDFTTDDGGDIQQTADISISLPPNISNMIQIKNMSDVRLSYTLYDSSSLFVQPSQGAVGPSQGAVGPSQGAVGPSQGAVGTRIIGGRIAGRRVKDLPEPVITTFVPIPGSFVPEDMRKVKCVFWDFDADAWSTEGCESKGEKMGRYTCACNHLTNFAIIFDVSGEGFGDHEKPLEVITIVGCVVSIVCLILTLLSFIVRRRDKRRTRTGHAKNQRLVLINLCVALLAILVIFLAGINRTAFPIGCKAVAALLHYFLLAALMWMAVEAVNLYRAVVQVFDSVSTNFVIQAGAVAWGFPLVATLSTAGPSSLYNYRMENACWLAREPLIYAFLIPAGLILLFNLLVFILVMTKLVREEKKQKELRGAAADANKVDRQWIILQIRRACSIMAIFGLTWVFGFFVIDDARTVFAYLFCIFNTLQGLFIFIFHCVMREDMTKWRKKLTCWKKFIYIGKKKKGLYEPRFSATSCARRSPTTPAKPVEAKHSGFRRDCSCGETVASAALRRRDYIPLRGDVDYQGAPGSDPRDWYSPSASGALGEYRWPWGRQAGHVKCHCSLPFEGIVESQNASIWVMLKSLFARQGQPREDCDKTDVFTWNMGLVIPEVFIRINMSASQPETPENTTSPR
ncbi:hypothetical protein Bbelb_051970 [Branchiostoma belcheri]|nr:hypothetical protein Bbelb_051970 [Branchiostoma belcheri]